MDVGTLGGVGASALAINDQDVITGYLTTTSSYDHGFRYVGGTFTDLGTLGGNYSYGLGINNNNAIVGGSFVDAKDSIYHAFIWDNGTMMDLNDHLDSTGAGWTLTEARAINDAGQITGMGAIGGLNHAFRLSPLVSSNPAPKITSIQRNGLQVAIRFTTVGGRVYSLQTNATLLSGGWGDLTTNIIGNGSTMSITNSGVGVLSKSFYRIRLLVP